MNKFIMIGVIALTVALGACTPDNSGSTKDAKATLQLTEQASTTIGIPAIINFTEKRNLKAIYELRDQANLVTYTYTIDLNGKRHKVCPTTSIGFGFPYATQFTAPESARYVKPLYPNGVPAGDGNWSMQMMAQPEPNGLYMPSSADGTWILCKSPDGKLAPTYVEPRVIVYTFEMSSVD